MLFTLIFSAIFIVGWSICGLVPWLVTSIVTRGNAGLGGIFLCIFAGNVAGATVPLIGFSGKGGFLASFFVAALASALLIAVRRFALGPVRQHT